MVFFGDLFHVINEGLEPFSVGLMAPAVPPLEVVHPSIDVVGDGFVRVDFHDAIQEQVSAQGRERPMAVGPRCGLVNQRELGCRAPCAWGGEFNAVKHVQAGRVNTSLGPKPGEGRHQMKVGGVEVVGANGQFLGQQHVVD